MASEENIKLAKDGDSPPSQVHLDALFGQFQEKDPITEFPRFQNVQVVKKGSGVLSLIREERIMARRKRLQQRLTRADGASHQQDPTHNADSAKDQDRMPTFQPVFESTKNLRRTILRSDYVLKSYVKGALRRRIARHQAVHQHFDALEKRIKNNQWLSKQRLSSKFNQYAQMANNTLDVQELTMLLNKHKKYGTELIKAKQSFVDELEDELKAMDDNFSRMLKSFQKDIDGIRKRATEFSTKLTSLCRREIYDLDKTFAGIESDYVKKTMDTWEDGHLQVREKDDKIMIQREELMEEILNNMKVLRTTKLDSFLEVKLILDNDVLLMTEQLQNMRASFLVNAEKLDYNLEIIQLREEESLKTKNKQKRIITKIQDELARATNELRADEKRTVSKLTKHKSQYIIMTTELVQLHQTYDEAVHKEWQMFRDCWISNELALRDTLRNLLFIDRFITEEICNQNWAPPNLWFLTHIGPIHAPRWRAVMENHRQELSYLPRPQLAVRLEEDQKTCWGIITDLNRRLSRFRRLSLVPRKPLRSTLPPIKEQLPGSNAVTQTQVTPYELPSHILGPVLRWIFNHLDFFNEDYVVDVLNELSWQDRFAFQMQAFLNEFKDFDYEDICKLALFFLRFSYKVSDKQQKVPPEPVDKDEVDEWLRNLTPEEFANRRIQFNDVFAALQAYMQDKRNQVGQENAHFDIVKAQGQGRDDSADQDYMNCYLDAMAVHSKTKEWNQLLYGMRKESQISEKKLQLTARTASLHDKNQKLKAIMKVQLSNKEDRKFVYPPLWSRMDDVAHELLKEIGQPDRQAGALAARQRLLPWHRHLIDKQGTNHGLPKSQSWTGIATSH